MTTTTITPDQIAELLEKAARQIETHGWTQQEFAEPYRPWDPVTEQRCCADGGIRIAGGVHEVDLSEDSVGMPGDVRATEKAFADWLLAKGEADPMQPLAADDVITRWNDAEDRTAEQVITALRDCARDLRTETGGES